MASHRRGLDGRGTVELGGVSRRVVCDPAGGPVLSDVCVESRCAARRGARRGELTSQVSRNSTTQRNDTSVGRSVGGEHPLSRQRTNTGWPVDVVNPRRPAICAGPRCLRDRRCTILFTTDWGVWFGCTLGLLERSTIPPARAKRATAPTSPPSDTTLGRIGRAQPRINPRRSSALRGVVFGAV